MNDAQRDPLDALLSTAAAPGHRGWPPDPEAELAKRRLLASLTGSGTPTPVRVGRYELVRCVGRGGMGRVFEAFDTEGGAPVALKVLHDASDRALARLKSEFRVLRDVSHPNLVTMYELQVDQGLSYFTMEFLDGPSLADVLARDAALDEGFVDSCLLQLVEALHALHERGTVHGDIKPSNILLREGTQLTLVDFGVAQALGDPLPTVLSGTPGYIAPEQAEGASLAPASDWYAVGVVLRQLLEKTGQPRTESGSRRPDSLRALCVGLLHPDPLLRYGGREILEGLGADRPVRASLWPSGEGIFVGREAELAALREAFGMVRTSPVVCALRGEPGIGKTALVEHFLDAPEMADALVLRGRCYEDEALPYKGVEGVIESLAAHLAGLSPAAREALAPVHTQALTQVFPALLRAGMRASATAAALPPPNIRRAAFAALTELLGTLAQSRRVVIFIDDMQWGDADGGALLSALLSAPEGPAMLFLGSARSDGEGPLLQALNQTPAGVRQLELGPLGYEACESLSTGVLGRHLDPMVRADLLREAGGSPLLLHALLRAGTAPGAGPRTYAQLMSEVLGEIDEAGRDMLNLVALAGCPVGLKLLGEATGRGTPPRVLLAALRSRRLVRSLARDQTFAVLPHHDRVREAVVAALTPEQRRQCHARLARAACETGLDDPEFLANQYLRADELGPAARYAECAGDRARETMALQRARALYAQALRCLAPERPAALVAKLADAGASAGDLKFATPLYLEAAATRPSESWKLRLRAAEMYLQRGDEVRARELLRPAMREARIPMPRGMLHAIVLGLFSFVRWHLGRRRLPEPDAPDDVRCEFGFRVGYMTILYSPIGVALVLWSAARALRHGSRAQQGRALATLAHVYSLLKLGGPARQDAMVEEALSLTRKEPLARAVALTCKALIAFNRSQCHDALATLDTLRRFIVEERLDIQWVRAQIDTLVASVCVLAGDFARVRSFAAEAEREAAEQGNRSVMAQMRISRAWACLAAGDPSVMQECAAQSRTELNGKRLSALYGIAVWGECNRLLYLGEPEAAQALMRAEAPRFARSGLERAGWAIPLAQMWCSVELISSRHPEDAHARRARAHVRRLDREPVPLGRATAALLRGGLYRRAGRTHDALLSYETAGQIFAQLGMEGYAAAAAYRALELRGAPSPLEDRVPWFALQSIADPARWVRMYAP